MCVIVSWGAHESFMHPIFVLKNRCDSQRLVKLPYGTNHTPHSITDHRIYWFIKCIMGQAHDKSNTADVLRCDVPNHQWFVGDVLGTG
jgi:hypothetical protein